MLEYFLKYFKNHGAGESMADVLSALAVTFIFILICLIIHIILKNIVLRMVSKIIRNKKISWGDAFLKHKFPQRAILIIPGIIFHSAATVYKNAGVINAIQKIASTYVLIIMLFVISSLLDIIDDIYRTKPVSRVRPIKGVLQVVKIVSFIIIAILILATLIGQSPAIILSSIGALAAVYSFVFKDSILGFIAGIQLTSNDMLRIGDWIEMSKYGADGIVTEITLNTVKVQNFDKTIVTIPAYALISDSFKNWRGMEQYGGRMIKRRFYIDINSICFCTPEMIEKFEKINYLKSYINEKKKEFREHNKSCIFENDVNGSLITNIGIFRTYLKNYVYNNPGIDNKKPLMVRQLEPCEYGVPMEVYAFTKDVILENYEKVQSDIFEHIFAVAGEFGLALFQSPSGNDIKSINIIKGRNNRTRGS